jgi:RNA-binding protein PNO1
MPAPTALQRAPLELAQNVDETMLDPASVPLPADDEATTATPLLSMTTVTPPTEEPVASLSMEDTPMTDETGRPKFPAAKSIPLAFKREQRNVPVPPHRLTPLKSTWPKIYPPLVEHLKLQVRMNMKSRAVELRTSSATTDTGALQKGEDFVKAFCLGTSSPSTLWGSSSKVRSFAVNCCSGSISRLSTCNSRQDTYVPFPPLGRTSLTSDPNL